MSFDLFICQKKEKLLRKLASRYESLTFAEMTYLLKNHGFELLTISGSHYKFYNIELGAFLILPVHNGDCKKAYKRMLYELFITYNLLS